MNWIGLCTRRPVAVSMITLGVLIFGLVSLGRLPVTLLPELSYPRLTVRAELPGAAPAEVETLLAKPIEEALGALKNLRRVVSVSRAGVADVRLEFDWGTVMDYAVLDIRERLDALVLPQEARRPLVLRFDPSDEPILRFALVDADAEGGDELAALKRLRRWAEELLQKPLEAVGGVAAVKISGGLEEEIEVRLDLDRLSARGLSIEAVQRRLAEENANLSGGRVEQGTQRYLVRALNQFGSLDDIRRLLLASGEGRPVYLEDVAEVVAGHRAREAVIRVNGREAVEIALYQEGEANAVRTAAAVRAALERIQRQLPPEVRLETLYDQSVFIRQAIAGVSGAALTGGLLAVLVLYLFLHNFWATLIVALAIPTSVIATFSLMDAVGVSLNLMSLGGLALAVGLLVDNAIVVLEAIARRREAGLEGPAEAAEAGARTVAGAITASTLTTVAVFFPMVFVEGIAGQLFADQALVVSGALLVSLLVSVSLIPMLAARQRAAASPASPPPIRERRGLLARAGHALFERLPTLLVRALRWPLRWAGLGLRRLTDPPVRAFKAGFAGLERRYPPLLAGALKQRGAVLGVTLLMGGLAWWAAQGLGLQLVPPLAQGEFTAQLRLPPGSPLARTDALQTRLQQAFAGDDRLTTVYGVAGTGNRLDADPEAGGEHQASVTFVLAPGADEAALQRELDARFAAEPGLSWRYTRPTLFTLADPVEVAIGGQDLAQLAAVAERVQALMAADPRFSGVRSSLQPGLPEVQIRLDAEQAARLGLTPAELAQRVVTAVQGSVATRYRPADREIDIRLRAGEREAMDLARLRQLPINPESERPIPLAAVAEIRLGTGPAEIRRQAGQRSIVVSAGVARGDLGGAIAALQTGLAELSLPPGVSVQVGGQFEEMEAGFASLSGALALAVFLVYLVMASKFESLKHPFVILFTVPLSLIGAVFALRLSGLTVDVVVLIGVIVLAGIVVNNGIVLVDAINQQRAAGLAREPAILEAARLRLRPIVMTTLTTVLGLTPLMLGFGDGAEVQQPLAVTVIGGLLGATLLTLFVIPVLYTLLDGPAAERPADAAP